MSRALLRPFLLVLLTTAAIAEEVPFDSERWQIGGQEARLEEHLGRPSLLLRGGMALLDDVELTNGRLSFDISVPAGRNFTGAVFRLQDGNNYEHFYIRPHQSGNPDANQYTPVDHGVSAWQLYHGPGFALPVTYRFDAWMHVEVVFFGERATVFLDVGDSDVQTLLVPQLQRPVAAGRIGLQAAAAAPAHFSNFRFERLDEPPTAFARAFPEPRRLTERPITSFAISNTFSEDLLESANEFPETLSSDLTWRKLEAGTSGIVNLARLQGLEGGNTAVARLVLDADRRRVVRLRFGFSDRVRIFLDRRLLFVGKDDYRSRDYRHLGTIGLFDEVVLPLEEGRNEVWLAVSESFGGWGLIAELERTEGVTIVSP